MPMSSAIVRMRGAALDTDEIQLTMPHAAFRNEQIGKAANRLDSSLENQTLYAVFVIEVRVSSRNGQLVMFVLQTGKTLGELALVVVIHIRQRGDAEPSCIALLSARLQMRAEQIAYRLTTRCVTSFSDPVVERFSKILT